LLSAELGEWNESANVALRKATDNKLSWLDRILGKGFFGYTFYLAERDEAGARILSDMRSRGISRAVVALAQSAEHVVSFFKMLRAELGFYCGCLNLYDRLARKGEPVCFPTPSPAGSGRLCFSGLYDVCLSLRLEHRVVGNAIRADGRSVVIVTGPTREGNRLFCAASGWRSS
jgi:DNA mismatch repair ATPase MutS